MEVWGWQGRWAWVEGGGGFEGKRGGWGEGFGGEEECEEAEVKESCTGWRVRRSARSGGREVWWQGLSACGRVCFCRRGAAAG